MVENYSQANLTSNVLLKCGIFGAVKKKGVKSDYLGA